MNQILPYHLWLGHAGDGSDYSRIFETGIEAIVQVTVEEPSLQPPRELIFCRFPLLDGLGNSAKLLFLAVNTVATFVQRRVPTLVCCRAGLSRAPVIAAAALAMAQQRSPDECLREVVKHHHSDISPGLWNDVLQLLNVPAKDAV